MAEVTPTHYSAHIQYNMSFEPRKVRNAVYILHNISVGGVEVALVAALPTLAKAYNLKVIVLGTVDPRMVAHLKPEERDVFVTFNYPVYLYPFIIPRIVKYILGLKPDIMIASLWRASWIGGLVKLANKNIKLYSFNHSTRFPHVLSKTFTLFAGKMADVILTDGIATTAFVKAQIKPKVPVKEVSFLTTPTPPAVQREAPDRNQEVKFMFLGRINKVKNLPLIIHTIQKLRESGVNATLDIYGRNDGGEVDIAELTKETAHFIRFKGEIAANERSRLFAHYHFYIQLSAFEGMAMSVAEAMQHGLVCVVSPVGEIVHYAVDMESAIFLNIHDPGALDKDISKISRVIDDAGLYQQISSRCHQNFLSKKLYPESLLEQLS